MDYDRLLDRRFSLAGCSSEVCTRERRSLRSKPVFRACVQDHRHALHVCCDYFPQWFHLRRLPPRRSAGASVAGVALCACGLLLLLSSRRALGKNWSDLVVVKKGHAVVVEGPYKWIRHPMYAGLVLALLGSALTVETRAAFSIAAGCFLGLFVKSRREAELPGTPNIAAASKPSSPSCCETKRTAAPAMWTRGTVRDA
jgi:hypothetical protein